MQRHRILIVEDSPTMRQLLAFALKRIPGAEIVEARDGMDGLRKVTSDHFDLALVDINMPDIHGLEVIKLIRASPQHRTVPVIVISSEASPRDRERGLALGADTWLAKPFTPEQLVDTVRRVLATPRAPEAT